ncbi:MAG: CBS domain-containing protein [Deltaproteobacteria bacterium]|nr:CBS domain-containing protein [Deltaproteobacteria bacterium]
MSDFPLARILEFVQAVSPFDTLPRSELNDAVAAMEIAYFPRETQIIQAGGEPSHHLYIIHSGSVRVSVPAAEEGEILVDLRGEGDVFGAISLLQGSQALFSVTAREDLLCFLLPAEYLRRLIETYPTFQNHFNFSLARNIKAASESKGGNYPLHDGGESLKKLASQLRSQVATLMSVKVLSCPSGTSIRQAAQMMSERQVGSILVLAPDGGPRGLVTDTDLRKRVVAGGVDSSLPVDEVMSHPVLTIAPQAFAFEAMLEMTRHGVHHLIVSKGGQVAGVISDHDVKVVTGASPVGLVREIDKITSVEELSRTAERIRGLLEMLLRLSGSPEYMLELLKEFGDRVMIKLSDLAEEHMAAKGLGDCPVNYTWLAVGAAGRGEVAPPVEFEHLLIYTDTPEGEKVRPWFLNFAAQVGQYLARSGLVPRSAATVLAEPSRCLPTTQCRQQFLDWIGRPDLRYLSTLDMMFDFRPVSGESGYCRGLRQEVMQALRQNPSFCALLAQAAVREQPPLGFLREFVVERDGNYSATLDLDKSLLTPIVKSARVLALANGIEDTSTLGRLAAASQLGILESYIVSDLRAAFGYATQLRVSYFLEALAQEQSYRDRVPAEELNRGQRSMLKDSFNVIAEMQHQVLEHYWPGSGVN